MTYTINPNAKNVWIRDNEDTMDLSPITDASSVYLENGRTIEQELGEGSMVSNVATVDTSMSKVIDGTLDGAYESGVLYGRSLVNADSYHSKSDFAMHNIDTVSDDGYIKLTANGTWRNAFTKFNGLLKPNTKYLAVVDIKTNTLTEGVNSFRLFTEGVNSSGVNNTPFIGQTKVISSGATGIFKYILTTMNDLSNCEINSRNYISNTVASGILEYRYVLIEYQEGMESWDIPFFTGLCDAKMPILRNVGKNLFNINGDINDGDGNTGMPLNTVTGTTIISNCYTNSYYGRGQAIKCKPNTKYSIYGEIANRGMMLVHLRGKRNYYLEYPSATSTFQTFYIVTPNDCEEFILAFNTNGSTGGGVISNVIVEEGTQSTTYEPYKTNILHTSEEIVLRSLPNGVQDTYNVITGEYVKRIGEVVLDGSESWTTYNDIFTNTIQYRTAKYNNRKTGTTNMINDRFPVINAVSVDDVEAVFGGQTSVNIYVKVLRSKITSTFEEYLQQNPITVQYELAEPITTKVTLTQSEPIVKVGREMPNGVCDTYNLLTGEYIQRVGKVVLDGSETWKNASLVSNDGTHYISYCPLSSMKKYTNNSGVVSLISDKFISETPVGDDEAKRRNREFIASYGSNAGVVNGDSNWIYLSVKKQKIADTTSTGFSNYLKSNPVTVWYELKNPVITKKNGLPNTHGVTLPNGVRDKYNESTGVYTQNIGRITFDGSEDWRQNQGGSYGFYCYHNESKDSSSFNCKELDAITGWNDYTQKGIFKGSVAWGVVVKSTDLTSCTVEAFKAWLKQNPITVEYEMVTPKTVDITPINVGQALPNGVCDTYNPITKQYTKRVGFIALNGSEDWVKHTEDSNQYTYKTTDVLSGYKITSSYCDTMKTEVIDSGISSVYGYSFIRVGEVDDSDGGDFGVFLHLEGGDIVQDVASLKTKLSLNPLNLWYELQTPETTIVDLDLTTLYSANPIAYENGHVIMESGYDGQSLLPTLEYSTITNRVKQIESIGEQVLRQEKQLTMLEQMLIKGIIGMDYNNILLTLNLEIDEVM